MLSNGGKSKCLNILEPYSNVSNRLKSEPLLVLGIKIDVKNPRGEISNTTYIFTHQFHEIFSYLKKKMSITFSENPRGELLPRDVDLCRGIFSMSI